MSQARVRPRLRPRLANRCRFQSDGSADASGSDTSTRVQPLFLADVARCSTISSATWRRSAVASSARATPISSITPTNGPDRTDGLIARTPTPTTRRSASATTTVAGGTKSRLRRYSTSSSASRSSASRASRRAAASRSVCRAFRTRTSKEGLIGCNRSACCWTTHARIPRTALNPVRGHAVGFTRGGNVLRRALVRRYDAAHLDRPGPRMRDVPRANPLEEGFGCRSTCDGAASSSC